MAQVQETETRASNDAYTGMLAISLIALIAACALLFLDYNQYSEKDPPKVKAPVINLNAPAADKGGAPPPPQQQQPMNPPMGENKGG